MQIAVVAPPWYEIPPRGYGGIESVCSDLVEGLVSRGHEVTLIGAGSDRTRATFIATYKTPPSALGTPECVTYELVHAARAARAIEEIAPDIVHDHSLAGPLTSRGRWCPTVATVHGPVDGEPTELYRNLPVGVSLVALSETQRREAPDLPWIGVVHNGIRVRDYPFRGDKDDFALFLGRLSPDKGPEVAIDAARAAGLPLLLAARCSEPAERAYFEDRIRPRLGPDVEWLGEADADQKKDLLSRARCLLAPVRWNEPFGLVLVEALACGTPVVGLRRGAVPELVIDGVTGFVCDRPEELPRAIAHVRELDPAACRRRAERSFDVGSMVLGYERVYARALEESRPSPAPATLP